MLVSCGSGAQNRERAAVPCGSPFGTLTGGYAFSKSGLDLQTSASPHLAQWGRRAVQV